MLGESVSNWFLRGADPFLQSPEGRLEEWGYFGVARLIFPFIDIFNTNSQQIYASSSAQQKGIENCLLGLGCGWPGWVLTPIQEAEVQEMVIIKIDWLACQMEPLRLDSDDDREEQKCVYDHIDSLSPTPSPTPSHAHLALLQNNTATTESELFPPLSPMGRGRRGKRGQEQARSVNRGHWSLQENKRYHWFLEIHYSHFVNRHMRRMDKIFKSMEMFVGTRQAEQCRSHHQKMEKKYLNFTTIISNLRKMHYNSQEVDPVLEDINNFGAHATEGLATIEYLMEQQAIEPPAELKERRKSLYSRGDRDQPRETRENRETREGREIKEPRTAQSVHEQAENREEGGKMEEERSQQAVFAGVDMLEDCELNIGELSLYHKEENSSIFNSIFL